MNSVFATQYAALEKEEDEAENQTEDEDRAFRSLRSQINDVRLSMCSQRSNELVLASLKEQVETTRSQLQMTARVATSLVAWRRRAHAAQAANA